MSRIESFKRDLEAKKAVKIIAGIDNFDIENIKKVVTAAEQAGASAVDICADSDIVKEIRSMTDLPLFVSSIVPEELAKAVELGADAIELGNFDVLYKKGASFSKDDVLALVKRTLEIIDEIIEKLKTPQTTLVLATTDEKIADRFCKRKVYFKNGSVVSQSEYYDKTEA